MNKEQIQSQLDNKRERLTLYYSQEKRMLSGGAQSYGIGSRNLNRYNTELNSIRQAIQMLEDEINLLNRQLLGKTSRKAIGVIPRDW